MNKYDMHKNKSIVLQNLATHVTLHQNNQIVNQNNHKQGHLKNIKNHNTDNTLTMIMYTSSNEHRKIDTTNSYTKKTKWNLNFVDA